MKKHEESEETDHFHFSHWAIIGHLHTQMIISSVLEFCADLKLGVKYQNILGSANIPHWNINISYNTIPKAANLEDFSSIRIGLKRSIKEKKCLLIEHKCFCSKNTPASYLINKRLRYSAGTPPFWVCYKFTTVPRHSAKGAICLVHAPQFFSVQRSAAVPQLSEQNTSIVVLKIWNYTVPPLLPTLVPKIKLNGWQRMRISLDHRCPIWTEGVPFWKTCTGPPPSNSTVHRCAANVSYLLADAICESRCSPILVQCLKTSVFGSLWTGAYLWEVGAAASGQWTELSHA